MPGKIQLFTEQDYAELEARGRCNDCGQALAGRWKLCGVVEVKGKAIRCVCDPCFREAIRRGGPVSMIDLATKGDRGDRLLEDPPQGGPRDTDARPED